MAGREPSDPTSESDILMPSIRCPFCGSRDVEPMALFGSRLLTAQCYCRACHTPFDRVRDGAAGPDASTPDLAPRR